MRRWTLTVRCLPARARAIGLYTCHGCNRYMRSDMLCLLRGMRSLWLRILRGVIFSGVDSFAQLPLTWGRGVGRTLGSYDVLSTPCISLDTEPQLGLHQSTTILLELTSSKFLKCPERGTRGCSAQICQTLESASWSKCRTRTSTPIFESIFNDLSSDQGMHPLVSMQS
jgi:hypothetical protein